MDTKAILTHVDNSYVGRHHKHAPNLPVYAWYLNERERMRIKREEQGLPRPWTEDPILDGFRFTNIHRGDDKVSRDLYNEITQYPVSPLSLFNMFVFRTFNTIRGYEAVGGWTNEYDMKKARWYLDSAAESGIKLFGNSYLMVNSMCGGYPPGYKHRFYVEKPFQLMWDAQHTIFKQLQQDNTLEGATRIFTQFPGYAGFLGYEMALDAEMVGITPHPTDKYTWGNIGPGAQRGLNYVFGRDRKFKQSQAKCLEELRWLWGESVWFLEDHVPEPIDMRVMENALCETSKYASVLTTGRAKRRYK